MPDYDVIVAGLGAMGSATAWQLAQRGARVLGLERFSIPNTQGSHHGHSRVIRKIYFEHPAYVPLLERAYELWRDLEVQSDQLLLHITGGIYIGLPDSAMLAGLQASAREHNVELESLDAKQLAVRFPEFRVPAEAVALYEAEAGVLNPELCVRAQVEQARAFGAELREYEPVLDWKADADGVSVETVDGLYHGHKLVLCCGAWSNDMLRDAGVGIAPTRQVVGWAWPTGEPWMEAQEFPVWLIELNGELHYGLPEFQGLGIKLARHEVGPVTDPHTLDRMSQAEDAVALEAFLARHLPRVAGPLVKVEVCIYENSPDGHFVLDFHPRHSNVLLACGFSGHGFKFAPVIGEALADLALGGATFLPVNFLSLARFSP